jgi:hypothetical protein
LRFTRYTQIHTYHVSKIFHAPLRFVYDWCTDYRETDPRITGSKSKRKILMRTKDRVVYVTNYRSRGKPKSAVDVVTLHPPKGWHLDFVGDEDDETGDYTLSSLGPRKTRLDMTFTGRYKIRGAPSKAMDAKTTLEMWDKYAAALDRDYSRTRS